MSLKSLISVLFLSIYVLGRATLSYGQVIVVNRNDIDSFLIKGGCSDNPNLCPRSSTCHSKSGLCLCDSRKTTYRDPEIITDGGIGLKYGSSYGCVNDRFIDSYGMGFYSFVLHFIHFCLHFSTWLKTIVRGIDFEVFHFNFARRLRC